MAGEWKQTRLGDHIALKGGLSYKGEFIDKGDALLIGMGCVSHNERFLRKGGRRYGGDFCETHLVRPVDLVIATRQQSDNMPILGFPAMIPEDFRGRDVIAATNLYKVTNRSEISNRFLYWLMRGTAYRERILGCAKGTTVRMLTKDAIEDFSFLCPPRAEREAIAESLDALDDKIELNRRINATLEAMARALFQSWFVDFDPVRAKLDGRPPAALDPATAALFPEHLEETALGHTPKGWEVCPLSEKIQLLSGGTPKTSEPTYWDGDIPWYSVRDAPSETDVWVIHTDKQVTKLGIANSAAQIFPEKTTIISARGTVGKLALTAVPMAMNQSCYGVRGVTGYGDYFTYYSLREATAQLQQRTHGTVFDTITTETFKTLDCIFPTPKITAAFDKLVEPLLGQIRANLHQSRTLATLRDTLLPKLLSGELSVAPTDKESLSVQNTSKKS